MCLMASSLAGDTINDDLIEWLFTNNNVAGRITHSDASNLFNTTVLPTANPVIRLLQNAHCSVTARHIGFPVPTHDASFNDPDEMISFLFNTDFMIGKLVESLSEGV